MTTLDSIALTLILGGLALSALAWYRYSNPANPPRATWRWTWTWTMGERFLGPGFRLYVVGTELIALGAAIALVGQFRR